MRERRGSAPFSAANAGGMLPPKSMRSGPSSTSSNSPSACEGPGFWRTRRRPAPARSPGSLPPISPPAWAKGAAYGDEAREARQELVDMRLAEPIGMKALQMDRGRRAAARQEARDDLLFEHAAQLARHPGRKKEARRADVEGKAAGRADRVVED